MSTAVAVQTECFLWHGLRFHSAPTRKGESERYECDEYPFRGWAKRCTSGQWVAAFMDSAYRTGASADEALEEARLAAIDNLNYRLGHFENLWRES